jgi:hypothetical protein
MEVNSQKEFAWLTSEAAEEHLAVAIRLFEKNLNPLKTAKLLRKSITPERAAMVMEQAQLRIRARNKFKNADNMFFTGRSLEQSSSELLATYKAKRFRSCQNLADICCGIGGDLMALAKRAHDNTGFATVGVVSDSVATHFAAANLKAAAALNVKVENASFADVDVSEFDGVHIDPDRRVRGRTTVGHFFEPTLKEIFERLSLDRQMVAIKVAPATDFEYPGFPIERQWIGQWRECKQQVLWAGPEIQEDTRVATVVAKDGARCHFRFLESDTMPRTPKVADEIGPFIYEPPPSILAAKLGVHFSRWPTESPTSIAKSCLMASSHFSRDIAWTT